MKNRIIVFSLFWGINSFCSQGSANPNTEFNRNNKVAEYELISVSPSDDHQYILNMKNKQKSAANVEIKQTEFHVDATSLDIILSTSTESCLKNKKTMLVRTEKEQYSISFSINLLLRPGQTILALKKTSRAQRDKYKFLHIGVTRDTSIDSKPRQKTPKIEKLTFANIKTWGKYMLALTIGSGMVFITLVTLAPYYLNMRK